MGFGALHFLGGLAKNGSLHSESFEFPAERNPGSMEPDDLAWDVRIAATVRGVLIEIELDRQEMKQPRAASHRPVEKVLVAPIGGPGRLPGMAIGQMLPGLLEYGA